MLFFQLHLDQEVRKFNLFLYQKKYLLKHNLMIVKRLFLNLMPLLDRCYLNFELLSIHLEHLIRYKKIDLDDDFAN